MEKKTLHATENSLACGLSWMSHLGERCNFCILLSFNQEHLMIVLLFNELSNLKFWKYLVLKDFHQEMLESFRNISPLP